LTPGPQSNTRLDSSSQLISTDIPTALTHNTSLYSDELLYTPLKLGGLIFRLQTTFEISPLISHGFRTFASTHTGDALRHTGISALSQNKIIDFPSRLA